MDSMSVVTIGSTAAPAATVGEPQPSSEISSNHPLDSSSGVEEPNSKPPIVLPPPFLTYPSHFKSDYSSSTESLSAYLSATEGGAIPSLATTTTAAVPLISSSSLTESFMGNSTGTEQEQLSTTEGSNMSELTKQADVMAKPTMEEDEAAAFCAASQLTPPNSPDGEAAAALALQAEYESWSLDSAINSPSSTTTLYSNVASLPPSGLTLRSSSFSPTTVEQAAPLPPLRNYKVSYNNRRDQNRSSDGAITIEEQPPELAESTFDEYYEIDDVDVDEADKNGRDDGGEGSLREPTQPDEQPIVAQPKSITPKPSVLVFASQLIAGSTASSLATSSHSVSTPNLTKPKLALRSSSVPEDEEAANAKQFRDILQCNEAQYLTPGGKWSEYDEVSKFGDNGDGGQSDDEEYGTAPLPNVNSFLHGSTRSLNPVRRGSLNQLDQLDLLSSNTSLPGNPSSGPSSLEVYSTPSKTEMSTPIQLRSSSQSIVPPPSPTPSVSVGQSSSSTTNANIMNSSTTSIASLTGQATNINKKRRPSTLIQLSTPSYKRVCEDFRTIFACKGIPESERLIADYACAYNEKILIQGRLYVTQHYFAFYANWIGMYEKYKIIKCQDVRSMTKASTLGLIPNAIHILTATGEKHIFASFYSRDKSFDVMSNIWCALMNAGGLEPTIMTPSQIVYEDVLGATSEAKEAIEHPALNFVAPESIEEEGDGGGGEMTGDPIRSQLSTRDMWGMVKENYGKNMGFTEEEIEMKGMGLEDDVENNNKPTAVAASALANGQESTPKLAKKEKKKATPPLEQKSASSSKQPQPTQVQSQTEKRSKSPSAKKTLRLWPLGSSSKDLTSLAEAPKPFQQSISASASQASFPVSDQTDGAAASSAVGGAVDFLVAATASASTPPKPVQSKGPPGKCHCPNHSNWTIVMDKTYPIDLEQLYSLIFLNPADEPADRKPLSFLHDLHQSRKTYDLSISNWTPLSAAKQADLQKDCDKMGKYPKIGSYYDIGAIKSRLLVFTVLLNHPLAKTCKTSEMQYLLQHDPGRCFVVHSEATNEGPPFSDSFVVNTTWCVTRTAEGGTRILVQYKISWVKSGLTLSMVKGTIDKSSIQGFTEFNTNLMDLLEKYIADGRVPKLVDGGDGEQGDERGQAAKTNGDIPSEPAESTDEATETSSSTGTTIIEVSNEIPTRSKLLWLILFMLLLVMVIQVVIIFRMYKIELNLRQVEEYVTELADATIHLATVSRPVEAPLAPTTTPTPSSMPPPSPASAFPMMEEMLQNQSNLVNTEWPTR